MIGLIPGAVYEAGIGDVRLFFGIVPEVVTKEGKPVPEGHGDCW